jgi:hypothetical protein
MADRRADRMGSAQRGENLFDLSLIGQAIQVACRDRGLRRINYEVLGNSVPWSHRTRLVGDAYEHARRG